MWDRYSVLYTLFISLSFPSWILLIANTIINLPIFIIIAHHTMVYFYK